MKLRQLYEQIDEANPEQFDIGVKVSSARDRLMASVYASNYDANKAKDEIVTILSLVGKIPWGGPLGHVQEKRIRDAIEAAGRLAYRTPTRENMAKFVIEFGESWYQLFIPKR
jgi:hypothetical protein